MRTQLSKLCKIAFALVFLLSVSTAVKAQSSSQPNNIQIYGSGLQYHGEIRKMFDGNNLAWGGGLSYNRYISPALDGGLHLVYNRVEAVNENPVYNFDGSIISGQLGLRLKAYGTILKEDAMIGPYLSATYGYSRVSSEGNSPTDGMFDEDKMSLLGSLGAGLRFRFSDAVSAFVQTSWMATDYDGIDGRDQDNWEQYLQHNVGLGFNLGKAPDADLDGVPDRRDDCPETPSGVQVDEKGCPIDTDGDGVADYQDQCPTEAGVANLGGCPDKDSDGVADKDDQCPDEAGTAATNGCPDTDGDGVADKDDECADTPAGVQVGPNGCPVDTDGDGVADNEDLCPNSPGTVETKGCPELDERTLKLIEEKVRFEFDQARVQDGYKQLLDSIVVALERYPDHVLLIKGHADHIGSEEYNQALSERRAQAVKDYLVERGVQNPDRLVTKGYGETQPLVKVNTRLSKARTARERAQNRRVGFELNTPDLQLDME